MSIADDASVSIILAEHASEDPGKRVNILAAGWAITGFVPVSATTPPQAVVVFVQVPSRYRGEQVAVGLSLLDQTGSPVQLPGPTGSPTALRIQHLALIDPPLLPGVHIPDFVPSTIQVVMRLDSGLPLRPNEMYTWEFELDGTPVARRSFYVAGPPPNPVLG